MTMAGESALKKAQSLRRLADRYERGAQGETATAHVLTELDAGSWTVIHDVAWPGRKLANIDHVVVGPAGVFVIDSKNWKGRITTVGGVLLCGGRSQAKTTRSAAEAAAAVGELLTSVNPQHVVPVLCFTDGDVPDGVIDGVLICSIVTVVHQLSTRPSVLAADEVQAVAGDLRRCLPAATESRSTPVAKSKPKAQKRRSRKPVVSAIAGLALAVTLLTNPGPFLALTDSITGLVTDQMKPPDDEPTPPPAEKKTENKKKNKRDGQSQR